MSKNKKVTNLKLFLTFHLKCISRFMNAVGLNIIELIEL